MLSFSLSFSPFQPFILPSSLFFPSARGMHDTLFCLLFFFFSSSSSLSSHHTPHYVAPRRLSPPASSTKEKRNVASAVYLDVVPPCPVRIPRLVCGAREEGHVVGSAAERIFWTVLVRHLRTELCVFCCCRVFGNGFDDVAWLISGVCVSWLRQSREKGALRLLVV